MGPSVTWLLLVSRGGIAEERGDGGVTRRQGPIDGKFIDHFNHPSLGEDSSVVVQAAARCSRQALVTH
jgi:hypothetical protein